MAVGTAVTTTDDQLEWTRMGNRLLRSLVLNCVFWTHTASTAIPAAHMSPMLPRETLSALAREADFQASQARQAWPLDLSTCLVSK